MGLFRRAWRFFDRLRMDRKAFQRKYHPQFHRWLCERRLEEKEAGLEQLFETERRLV